MRRSKGKAAGGGGEVKLISHEPVAVHTQIDTRPDIGFAPYTFCLQQHYNQVRSRHPTFPHHPFTPLLRCACSCSVVFRPTQLTGQPFGTPSTWYCLPKAVL